MTDPQMTLALEEPGGRALPDIPLPTARRSVTPFDDAGRFFEPWWPGAQAILRIERGRAHLRTEHLGDALETFPELRRLADDMHAERAILTGTLLALDDEGRPDVGLLRQMLAATQTRRGSGAFVATDLAWIDGEDMRGRPYRERRKRLMIDLDESDHAVVSRGLMGEGRTLAHAVAAMGLDAISARRLEGRWPGRRGSDDWLRIALDDAPAVRTRPFLVLLERLPLDR